MCKGKLSYKINPVTHQTCLKLCMKTRLKYLKKGISVIECNAKHFFSEALLTAKDINHVFFLHRIVSIFWTCCFLFFLSLNCRNE